jgi:hypothetical protein
MREESAMQESMDFMILSSTIQPAVTVTARAPQRSEEEQEMWDHDAFGNAVFDAGIDHTLAATEERKRLEQEATNFDLWHGTDFLPEEDPNDGELLLDELEQDDILSELLRNARKYIPLNCFYTFQCILYFSIDLNAPDVADVLNEGPRDASKPKIADAWSPYESKMASRLFNPPTND